MRRINKFIVTSGGYNFCANPMSCGLKSECGLDFRPIGGVPG